VQTASLKRFKDDVKRSRSVKECGISLENFDKVHVADIFEPMFGREKNTRNTGRNALVMSANPHKSAV
jgi:translation initiation factor IF-2